MRVLREVVGEVLEAGEEATRVLDLRLKDPGKRSISPRTRVEKRKREKVMSKMTRSKWRVKKICQGGPRQLRRSTR